MTFKSGPRAALLAIALTLPFALPAFAQEAAEHKAGHKTEGGHEGAGGHDDNLTSWKFATFALLAGALGYFWVKNAGPFFRSRTDDIRRGIDESRKMREQAEARAAEMDARLASLGVEIENLKKSARAEAEAEGRRVRLEAEKELARIQEQTEQEIQATVKAAQVQLRQHAGSLAVSLARQKAQARITDADQDRLIQTFVAGAGRHSSSLKSAE